MDCQGCVVDCVKPLGVYVVIDDGELDSEGAMCLSTRGAVPCCDTDALTPLSSP